LAVTKREKGVIAAEADVHTRVEFGAALAHEDIAAQHVLAAKPLHAETLTRAVATVARGTASFFVRHD
jgi:hypothetical protein